MRRLVSLAMPSYGELRRGWNPSLQQLAQKGFRAAANYAVHELGWRVRELAAGTPIPDEAKARADLMTACISVQHPARHLRRVAAAFNRWFGLLVRDPTGDQKPDQLMPVE